MKLQKRVENLLISTVKEGDDLNEQDMKNIIKDIGEEYVPNKTVKQKPLDIIIKLLGLTVDKHP